MKKQLQEKIHEIVEKQYFNGELGTSPGPSIQFVLDLLWPFVEVAEKYIEIDNIDKSGKPLISNQGQGMDGYTKLANYESITTKAHKALSDLRAALTHEKTFVKTQKMGGGE